MKNKYIALIAAAAAVNLLAVFLIWKLYFVPGFGSQQADNVLELTGNGVKFIAIIYIVIMALKTLFR